MKEQKLKIFTAAFDFRFNKYLEEEVEAWRTEKGKNRIIINSNIAIYNLNVILLVIYKEN